MWQDVSSVLEPPSEHLRHEGEQTESAVPNLVAVESGSVGHHQARVGARVEPTAQTKKEQKAAHRRPSR
ncbi:MAG: hypothetical protein RLZZ282_165 [Verrucomicrobiota bacterium]